MRQPEIEHVIIHVLRSPAFSGYRVAFLSDFHLAPWQGSGFLANAVDIANSWAPDLIALGGDYGYSVRALPPVSRACYRRVIPRVARELARLTARDGVFAVLGNHDVDGGSDLVQAALAAIGIRLLRSEVHTLMRHDRVFRIGGVDDVTRSIPQFHPHPGTPAAMVDATLLISHHPDVLFEMQMLANRHLVIIAGHTHGGQITFPVLGAPITLSRVATRRFPAGFIPNESAVLYVTRGLGEQVPLRVKAVREITLLEFRER